MSTPPVPPSGGDYEIRIYLGHPHAGGQVLDEQRVAGSTLADATATGRARMTELRSAHGDSAQRLYLDVCPLVNGERIDSRDGIDPIEASRRRSHEYTAWVEDLRIRDVAFAEASALESIDADEWQSAVYMLTGSQAVWSRVGSQILADRHLGVFDDLRHTGWSSSEKAVADWGLYLWTANADGLDEPIPYSFDRGYFHRWITALHLRRHMAPAALFQAQR